MAYQQSGFVYNPDVTMDVTHSDHFNNAMDAQSEDGFVDAREHMPMEEEQTRVDGDNGFQSLPQASIEPAGMEWQQSADASAATSFPIEPHVPAEQPAVRWQQPALQNFRQYKEQAEAPAEVGNEEAYNEQAAARFSYNPADDPLEEIKVQKENNHAHYSNEYLKAISKSAHSPGCPGHAVAEITPATSPPLVQTQRVTAAPQETAWQAPNADKDLSKTFTKYRDFHSKASVLRPQPLLSDHRYWIGVLLPGVRPNNINREDQFMWFKGNRFTTVETIWHIFADRFVKENFVLMLGAERLEKGVKMEECDLVNDKIVILRYMDELDGQSKGREISGALVPKEIEVIDLD